MNFLDRGFRDTSIGHQPHSTPALGRLSDHHPKGTLP